MRTSVKSCRLSELLVSVRLVGVTTAEADNSRCQPSPVLVICRRSQELTREHRAVLRRRRWRTRCRRRGRREDAPVAVSRSTTPSSLHVEPSPVDVARPPRRRSRTDDRVDPGIVRRHTLRSALLCPCRCRMCCCRSSMLLRMCVSFSFF